MFRKLIITAIIIYVNVNSQCTQEWVARYNNGQSDKAYSLAIDGVGNVYVIGSSYASLTGLDYATIKYNSSGVLQWIQRYSGIGFDHDEATSIAVDAAGNVYVTGHSYNDTTYYDYATIKYNSSGVQQWVQRYNTPNSTGDDEATSIAVDSAGNVYVTGIIYGGGTSNDYATIKYNSSGDSLWVRIYNGPGNGSDGANSIAVDGAGNVYVTGSSFGSGTSYDYATIKYNSSGVQQWVQRYTGPVIGSDEASSLVLDEVGNVYVTGKSYGSGTSYDYATIKYNSSGVQQWVNRYFGPTNQTDAAMSIAVDGTGNVYVTGYSRAVGITDDYATIKYDSSGVQQWVQRYNGPGNADDDAYSIAVGGAGDVYVTGRSVGSGTGYDYSTIKYNSSGVQQWIQRYNGPGNSIDEAYSIAVDGSGNVYVSGSSYVNAYTDDYATVKYSQTVTGVKEENKNPSVFKLYQNYPNPFNPITNIKFDIPKAQYVKLTVFDILGREVSKLVDEFKKAGKYEITFDAEGLSSGTYFYKLETDDYKDIKKLILIK